MRLETFVCLGCGERVAAQARPRGCKACGRGSGFMRPFSEASYALAGMEGCDSERESAAGVATAQRLSERLRAPGRDVSADAGEMERNSPLFFGTGENPTLFG
jgi:hypothetical protein